LKVLRDKSGASLIFVLAAMLLLMAIGVSVVTAAGYNLSAGLTQRDRNQLDLYVSSMEQTIHAALLEDIEGATIDTVSTLGGLILKDAYRSGDGQYTRIYPLSISIPDSVNATYTVSVAVTINVRIFTPEYEIATIPDPDSDPDMPDYIDIIVDRSPQLAYANGTVTVTQTTTNETSVFSDTPLGITTVTTYSYSGVVILEDYAHYSDPVTDSNMHIVDPGMWTVIRHEKTSK